MKSCGSPLRRRKRCHTHQKPSETPDSRCRGSARHTSPVHRAPESVPSIRYTPTLFHRNTTMQKTLLALGLSAALLLAGCGTTMPQRPLPEKSVPANISQADIRDAVIQAVSMRNWKLVSEKPGLVTVAYPSGAKAAKFQATYNVKYDADSYEITYVSSYGLDERVGCNDPKATTKNNWRDVPCYHRNVNRWMVNLSYDIDRILSRTAATKNSPLK